MATPNSNMSRLPLQSENTAVLENRGLDLPEWIVIGLIMRRRDYEDEMRVVRQR
jgi:hypothetical protein